jgi:hypothetical protein
MKALLIVYHSMTGGALQMAQAAAAGARLEPTVAVSLLRAAEARAQDLLAADGYIFATPENLAGVSGISSTERIMRLSSASTAGPSPPWSAPAATGAAPRSRYNGSRPAGASNRSRILTSCARMHKLRKRFSSPRRLTRRRWRVARNWAVPWPAAWRWESSDRPCGKPDSPRALLPREAFPPYASAP